MMDPEIYTLRYTFKIQPKEVWSDLLIDDLGKLGFETFEETTEGFLAYVQEKNAPKDLSALLDSYSSNCEIEYEVESVVSENWNAKWESSFEPVIVDDTCIVKADFHKTESRYPYEITINPKMSFGTGHHQTTHMMIRALLQMDVKGEEVLDMGSGTGVLAILASMIGADKVTAIDIDEWAYHNCVENVGLNKVDNAIVEKGDASLLVDRSFNTILANINKNVLLQDFRTYSNCLKPQGKLVISGFYKADIDDLNRVSNECGLIETGRDELQNWASVRYQKTT